MPPKKKEEVKEKPILGRFRTNLKVRAVVRLWNGQGWRVGWGWDGAQAAAAVAAVQCADRSGMGSSSSSSR